MLAYDHLGVDGANELPLRRKTIGGSKSSLEQPEQAIVQPRFKAIGHLQANQHQPSRPGPHARANDFIDLTGDDDDDDGDGDSSSEDVEVERRYQLQKFGLARSDSAAQNRKAESVQPHAPLLQGLIGQTSADPHLAEKSRNARVRESSNEEPLLKRKRGRPAISPPHSQPVSKKPRGRPRSDQSSLFIKPSLITDSVHPFPTERAIVPNAEHNPRVSRTPKPTISDYWRPKGTINVSRSITWMQRHAKHPLVKQLNSIMPAISIVNEVDQKGPPEEFVIISQYEYTTGTTPLDPGARYGCACRNCETKECDCLQDCAEDESGRPLGFPYAATGPSKGCLLDKYLDERHVIYECNELCDCGAKCKNKVVLRGRRVPLEVFKTRDRGWGLRCHEDLLAGQFVEAYFGEIVTDAEAKRRESLGTKDSYLFMLDKFADPKVGTSLLYVVDGEKRGSVARFINHCCDPNLRVFAVCFDRGDPRVYQLAFFACEYIPAGTELTFDYLDRDSEDHEDELQNRILSQKGEPSDLRECRCGAPNCRKWLWQ